jgi:hypothetical protein
MLARLTYWRACDDPRSDVSGIPPTRPSLDDPPPHAPPKPVPPITSMNFPVPRRHITWELLLHDTCADQLTRLSGYDLERWHAELERESVAS